MYIYFFCSGVAESYINIVAIKMYFFSQCAQHQANYISFSKWFKFYHIIIVWFGIIKNIHTSCCNFAPTEISFKLRHWYQLLSSASFDRPVVAPPFSVWLSMRGRRMLPQMVQSRRRRRQSAAMLDQLIQSIGNSCKLWPLGKARSWRTSWFRIVYWKSESTQSPGWTKRYCFIKISKYEVITQWHL